MLGPAQLLQGLWSDLLTSRKPGIRRLQTEPGETGSLDGRVFRFPYKYSVASAGELVIRVTSPIDFKLTFQNLSLDQGGIEFNAYRAGTPTGTFDTPLPTFGSNGASVVESYVKQITFETASGGATFAPGANPSAEVIRLRTSNATAQKTTVSGAPGDSRTLGAGVYYLQFKPLSGVTETSTGVYTLRYEELPPGTV